MPSPDSTFAYDFAPSPCLRSGHCCKSGPCPFGEWDDSRSQCRFLEVAVDGEQMQLHRCGIYEQIKDAPGADWAPAFSAGCSSTLFNTRRESVLVALLDKDGPDHAAAVELLGPETVNAALRRRSGLRIRVERN